MNRQKDKNHVKQRWKMDMVETYERQWSAWWFKHGWCNLLFFPWVGWLEKWAYPTCKSLMPFTSIGRFHFYFTIFTAERWMNCLLHSQEPTSTMQTCNPLPFEIWSLNRVFSVFRLIPRLCFCRFRYFISYHTLYFIYLYLIHVPHW